MNNAEQDEFRQKVLNLLHSIPVGKVCTYGQLARLADHPAHARLVGRLLSRLPAGSHLPWFRVTNASGQLTSPGRESQKQRLEAEGIVVLNGRVSLKIYQWQTS